MFFKTQNGEKNCIRPGLLLYYKKMLAYLLANQYTPLGIVNGARTIIYRIVLNLNSKDFTPKSIIANQK